jgi:hypothetical protein
MLIVFIEEEKREQMSSNGKSQIAVAYNPKPLILPSKAGLLRSSIFEQETFET